MSTWDQLRREQWRAHRWRTEALLRLLATKDQAGPLEDYDRIVRENLRYRDRAFADKTHKDLLFPVALADPTHATSAKPWHLPAVYFWFAMCESLGEDPGGVVRLRNMYKVGIDSLFRDAIGDGFRQCRGGDRLFLCPEAGLVYQDEQEERFIEKSVGLAVAAWGSWYLRGVWPSHPIAISGVLGEDGGVVAPNYIEEKLGGLAEHAIDYLVVPEGGTKVTSDRLIQVSYSGGDRYFHTWLKSCEACLAERDVRLSPHPRLWRKWSDEDAVAMPHEQLVRIFERNLIEKADKSAFYGRHLLAGDIEQFDASAVETPSVFAATVGGEKDLMILLDLKLHPAETIWLCTEGVKGVAEQVNDFTGGQHGRRAGDIALRDPVGWTEAIMKRVAAMPFKEQRRALVDVTGGLRHYSFGLVTRLKEHGFPGTISYVWTPDYGSVNTALPARKTLVVLHRPEGAVD